MRHAQTKTTLAVGSQLEPETYAEQNAFRHSTPRDLSHRGKSRRAEITTERNIREKGRNKCTFAKLTDKEEEERGTEGERGGGDKDALNARALVHARRRPGEAGRDDMTGNGQSGGAGGMAFVSRTSL